ncbi:MAG: hypothetical protein RL458_1696, partial [Pseudomonadota bacterium]
LSAAEWARQAFLKKPAGEAGAAAPQPAQ